MLANLEVLAVTNAGISGPLPLEYADYLAMQKVATRAATAAATAAARAAATAERSRRAASFPSGTSFGKNSTLDADADRAQRMRAAKDYSRAQQRAALAQRVAQAVQAAAGNATGRGASGLGMLKLRQLLLNGNNLSGSLPVQYAQMRDLQVREDGQPCMQLLCGGWAVVMAGFFNHDCTNVWNKLCPMLRAGIAKVADITPP